MRKRPLETVWPDVRYPFAAPPACAVLLRCMGGFDVSFDKNTLAAFPAGARQSSCFICTKYAKERFAGMVKQKKRLQKEAVLALSAHLSTWSILLGLAPQTRLGADADAPAFSMTTV